MSEEVLAEHSKQAKSLAERLPERFGLGRRRAGQAIGPTVAGRAPLDQALRYAYNGRT